MAAATGGYWQASDLAQLAPHPGNMHILASQSALDATQFQTMIALVSARFDAAAAKVGYAIPIPSNATSTGFLFAQSVVADGAFAQAFQKVYTGPDKTFVSRYQTAFETVMKAIAAGDMPIPGAAMDSSSSGRLLVRSGGVPSAQIIASMAAAVDQIPTDF